MILAMLCRDVSLTGDSYKAESEVTGRDTMIIYQAHLQTGQDGSHKEGRLVAHAIALNGGSSVTVLTHLSSRLHLVAKPALQPRLRPLVVARVDVRCSYATRSAAQVLGKGMG